MATAQAISHTGAHDAHHHETDFWRTYVFSTDHKIIGIQYAVTALFFLSFPPDAGDEVQIAHPGQPVPLVGGLLENSMRSLDGGSWAPKGVVSPDLYNIFGAMHGTIMVFMAIVPLAFAAFGNFVVPLQIGAPDMAFPRVNMASYQAYVIGGLIMFVSFFIPGGPAQAGWTLLAPGYFDSHARPGILAGRDDFFNHFLTFGRGEFHRYHHSIARSGNDLDAPAIFCLGAVCYGLLVVAGFSPARSRWHHAIDG